MQIQAFALTIAAALTAVAKPVPEPIEVGLDLLSREAQGICSSGFTITTYATPGCGVNPQGDSNSGKGCSVCVEMGNAQSWRIGNPDHCSSMSVAYYHGAGCSGGAPTTTITYNTGETSCNQIPTNIGDHFSAEFVCLQG